MVIVYSVLSAFALIFIIAMIAGYVSDYGCKNPFPPPPPPKRVESNK